MPVRPSALRKVARPLTVTAPPSTQKPDEPVFDADVQACNERFRFIVNILRKSADPRVQAALQPFTTAEQVAMLNLHEKMFPNVSMPCTESGNICYLELIITKTIRHTRGETWRTLNPPEELLCDVVTLFNTIFQMEAKIVGRIRTTKTQ